MKSARVLREKILSERLTLGMIVTNHFWIDLLEIARNAGLDYLIIDTEHVAFDEEKVADACSMARLIDFPVLIRPPESEYSFVRRALDKGAVGVMLPQVEGPQTLDKARDAVYMPPRGRRRVGGPGNRWPKDFQYASWRQTVEDELIVLPQIESRQGLQNVESIARHELTTALAIGPYDLSADLGVCWKPDDPKLQDALRVIRRAGRAVGKNTLMVGDGPTLIRNGFTFICAAEPTYFLERALREHVAAMRRGGSNGDSDADPESTSKQAHVP
jgi:2-keto-3-deoxy-L-rhamnonate aldolase RhmA